MLRKSWMKTLAWALALPSTTIGMAYVCYALQQEGVVSRPVAVALFIGVVAHTVFAMVYYAYKKKA